MRIDSTEHDSQHLTTHPVSSVYGSNTNGSVFLTYVADDGNLLTYSAY